MFESKKVKIPQLIAAVESEGFSAKVLMEKDGTGATKPKRDCGLMNAFC